MTNFLPGRGTLSELRSRLGVVPPPATPPESSSRVPSRIMIKEAVSSSSSQIKRIVPFVGPQEKRKRQQPERRVSASMGGVVETDRLFESKTVFAVSFGESLRLDEIILRWRSTPATSTPPPPLHQLNKLEYISERVNYPLLHGVIHSEAEGVLSDIDVFVMEFGCIVCWGCSRVLLGKLVESLYPFVLRRRLAKPRNQEIVIDDLAFTQPLQESLFDDNAKKNLSYIYKDNIILGSHLFDEKLAYSYAFAQSVKLTVLEKGLARSIEGVGDLPNRIAKSGSFGVGNRKIIARRIGELYVHGCDVNLRTDILEIPDVLWDMDEVLPIYHLCRRYLDVQGRLDVLNQKFTVMGEMYSMIQRELHVNQAVRIEWIIIILICVDIFLELIMMIIEWITAGDFTKLYSFTLR